MLYVIIQELEKDILELINSSRIITALGMRNTSTVLNLKFLIHLSPEEY